MKKTILSLVGAIIIVGLIYFITERSTFNESKEKEEIARVIDSNIGWFKDKDFELMFKTVAHDSNFISVHPTDRVVRGYDQFLENSEIFKNPEFLYVRHETKDLKITMKDIEKTLEKIKPSSQKKQQQYLQ